MCFDCGIILLSYFILKSKGAAHSSRIFLEALYSSFVANTLQEMGSFSFQLRWIFSLVFLFFFWNFVLKVSLKEKVLTSWFDCSSNQLTPAAPLIWKYKVTLNFSVESGLIFEFLIKFCIDLSIFSSKHGEIGVLYRFLSQNRLELYRFFEFQNFLYQTSLSLNCASFEL